MNKGIETLSQTQIFQSLYFCTLCKSLIFQTWCYHLKVVKIKGNTGCPKKWEFSDEFDIVFVMN